MSKETSINPAAVAAAFTGGAVDLGKFFNHPTQEEYDAAPAVYFDELKGGYSDVGPGPYVGSVKDGTLRRVIHRETVIKTHKKLSELELSLVEKYAGRGPKVFIQVDAHTRRVGSVGDWSDSYGGSDIVSDPYDDDGDALNSSVTVECMGGANGVRLLFQPDITKEEAVRLLKKVTAHIEKYDIDRLAVSEEEVIKNHRVGWGELRLMGELRHHTWCSECETFLENIKKDDDRFVREDNKFICKECHDKSKS
jgi:hypothetical protein